MIPLTDRNTDTELARLLDNGYAVVLYKNQLKSYTATAIPITHIVVGPVITDDRRPAKAIARLADKMYGEGEYSF